VRGERNRDLFLVLRGAVEVRRNGRRVAVSGPGDVLGEVAFLLETSRTADLVAATDDVVVVRIAAEHLTALVERDAATAAPLWLGLAMSLASKFLPGDT
jgi:CRP-like cAMP-binding protein